MSASRALTTRMVEKVWGRDKLPAPFAAPEGKRIGEIWFEPPPELDELLVKYLFTSDKLSVQVHPSDAQAPSGGSGKEECWLVLDAEPGATLAIGFREEQDAATVRAGALDGSIEQMLDWHPVKPGDFFYIPAGTVHAIGPGLALVEIQQNSDITYRFYDYGRDRALHLDESMGVAQLRPHDPALRRQLADGETAMLVDGPHFRLDRVAGPIPADIASRHAGALLAIPLSGAVELAGQALPAGSCGLAQSVADIAASADAVTLLASAP